MKTMKALFITLVFLAGFSAVAQEKEVVRTDKSLKISTFHDNGILAQTGHQLKGKNHGVWQSYDKQGNRMAIGEYTHGKKTGTWVFWINKQVVEVTYQDNQIAQVSYWEPDAKAVANY